MQHTNPNETIESVASYTVGGAGITIASLADLATTAQSITIILACLVVSVRLAHDSVRLWRYLKEKNK
jgi:hypothetical protein